MEPWPLDRQTELPFARRRSSVFEGGGGQACMDLITRGNDGGLATANPANVSQPDVHEVVEFVHAATIHLENQIVYPQAIADVADLVHCRNLLGDGLVAAELGFDGHEAHDVESDPPRVYDGGQGDHALVDQTIDTLAHRRFRDAQLQGNTAVGRPAAFWSI